MVVLRQFGLLLWKNYILQVGSQVGRRGRRTEMPKAKALVSWGLLPFCLNGMFTVGVSLFYYSCLNPLQLRFSSH